MQGEGGGVVGDVEMGLGEGGSGAGEGREGSVKEESSVAKRVRETEALLRKVQAALFDEQLFAEACRELQAPGSSLQMLSMTESSLVLALPHGATLSLHMRPRDEAASEDLLPAVSAPSTPEDDDTLAGLLPHPQASPLGLVLRKAFLSKLSSAQARPPPPPGETAPTGPPGPTKAGKEGAGGKKGGGERGGGGGGFLDEVCSVAKHYAFRSLVFEELETLALNMPYVTVSTVATWHPRMSAWSVSLPLPESLLAQKNRAAGAPPAQKKTKANHRNKNRRAPRHAMACQVTVRDEELWLEGWQVSVSLDGGGEQESPGLPTGQQEKGGVGGLGSDMKWRTPCELGLPVLRSLLLEQIAVHASWMLHRMALALGHRSRRDSLTVYLSPPQELAAAMTDVGGSAVEISAYPVVEERCVDWEARGPLETGERWRKSFVPTSFEGLRDLLLELLPAPPPVN